MTKDTMTSAARRPASATQAGPAASTTPTNPIRTRPTQQLVAEALQTVRTPADPPTWSHRLLPPKTAFLIGDQQHEVLDMHQIQEELAAALRHIEGLRPQYL